MLSLAATAANSSSGSPVSSAGAIGTRAASTAMPVSTVP
jgi:hypothetical protein